MLVSRKSEIALLILLSTCTLQYSYLHFGTSKLPSPLFSTKNLKLEVEGGFLSYDYLQSETGKNSPVVFLPGLVREKNEAKCVNLMSFCKKNQFSYLSADYYGVGHSSGSIRDATVSRWTSDVIRLITNVLDRREVKDFKVILVGHGVGAWIAFLIAQQRPDLVRGIVGLSADPDFTDELLWKRLPEDVKRRIMDDGVHEITWGKEKYPITKALIEDGRKNLLLTGEPGGWERMKRSVIDTI